MTSLVGAFNSLETIIKDIARNQYECDTTPCTDEFMMVIYNFNI